MKYKTISVRHFFPAKGAIYYVAIATVIFSHVKITYNMLFSHVKIMFLDQHQIFYKYQFEFRKGYSTEQAILEITDNLKPATDKIYTIIIQDLSVI